MGNNNVERADLQRLGGEEFLGWFGHFPDAP
jgi:hypothetical protein